MTYRIEGMNSPYLEFLPFHEPFFIPSLKESASAGKYDGANGLMARGVGGTSSLIEDNIFCYRN